MSFVKVENVYLDYPLVGVSNHSLKNRILGAATGGLISSGGSVPIVNALRDINFSLKEEEGCDKFFLVWWKRTEGG